MALGVLCLIATAAAVLLMRKLLPRRQRPFPRQIPREPGMLPLPPVPVRPPDWIDCAPSPPPPPIRTEFGCKPGVTVLGRPAKGGLYVLQDCLGLELDFLQLDRFHETRCPPRGEDGAAADEEAHCDRMRRLDAVWWRTESGYRKTWSRYPTKSDPFMRVGWPAGGGVWVLNTTTYEAAGKGAALIQNAYNMEERCRAIEQFGGVFYADPKDCPCLDLP